MAKRKEALHWIDHPDDVFYDEAKIVTVERYKTSGLSGDEWRFSYKVELYRKGQLVAWTQVGSFEYAALQLLRATMLALVELEGDEHWETIDHRELRREGFCCQPGCSNRSVGKYVLKKLFDKQCRFEGPNDYGGGKAYREFCEEHLERGDCGLDDANENYICIEGKDWTGAMVDPTKIRESIFGGMVHIKDLDL